MQGIDPFLTVVVFVPFVLLAGYYLGSILKETLVDPPEGTEWAPHAYFAVLLLAQVAGILILLLSIYLVARALTGAG